MAIRWDKLTVKAQEAMQRANELASEHGNPELQPVHILAALLEDHEGIVAPLLERVGTAGAAAVQAEAMRADRAAAQSFGRGAAQAILSTRQQTSCWIRPSKRRRTSKMSMSRPNTCCSA